ncbi:MAG: hypothetical protein V4599_04255 [Verrucomicrobiota bacterium]
MSELPGSEVNPYAPPGVDVLGAEALPPQPLLRPRSTKWAIFILLVKVVVIHWIHWGIIQESGLGGLWDAYAEQWGSLAALVLSFLGLAILVFTQRSRVAYALASLALVVLFFEGVTRSYLQLRTYGNFENTFPFVLDAVIQVVLFSLFLYLPYRFIFGLPSRQYYRIGI